MKPKKSAAIEFETVVAIIIVLVVLGFLLLLFSKYGGSMYNSFKQNVMNILALANNTALK